MPKFEPVAKVLVIDEVGRELVFNLQKPLHTADQLTEAYEAGKREASEDIEQAAFEKWLYDKCPSGDVESVQRQWLKSYEYAEFAEKLEQAAQIEMMQEAQIDAERNRWLRNALSDRSENGVSHHFCSIRTSEELDDSIDAAIAAASKGEV